MNLRYLFLPLCLFSFSLSALAGDEGQAAPPLELQAISPALKLEIVVTEGESLVTKGTMQGDVDILKDFHGTTRLRFPDGSRWAVDAEIRLAYEKGQYNSARPAMLEVDVSDLALLRSPSGESNTILPLRIFATQVSYHGTGSYPLFSDGELKVTVNVVEE